jgi:hypothetical protein
MKIITTSSLAKLRECPRKYFFEFEKKRLPVSESRARSFGKLWHSVLEAWWKGSITGAVAYLKGIADQMDEDTAAKLAAMIACYNPPRDKYDVIGVEQVFEMKIENPNGGRAFYGYKLSGKIDLILKDKATG